MTRMPDNPQSVVLLIHCKDRKGIVARVAGFIHDFGGNILDSDHHTDRELGQFLMRTEFALEGFQIPPGEIASAFTPVAKAFEMRYEVHYRPSRRRVAILVSKQCHRWTALLPRPRPAERQIAAPSLLSTIP